MGNNYLLEAAKISNTQIGFQTLFNKALKQASDSEMMALGLRVPSSNSQEQYNHFGAVPMMSRWLDDRKMSKLRAEKLTIDNHDWANGIEVHKNDIIYDNLGLVIPTIEDLAVQARRHPGKTMTDLLVNGFDGTVLDWSDGKGYDGQFFFSATHSDGGSSNQSNVTTAVLSESAYDTALEAMMGFVDENGEPLEVNPTHLIVGPSNRKLALQITEANLAGVSGAGLGPIDNVNKGTTKVIVNKRLVGSHAAKWFIVDLSMVVKPLIHQVRQTPRFAAATSDQNEDVFMRQVFKYGADSKEGFGYGLWQLAYGSDGTV